ncbi:MAG: PA2928 family protein [Caulobacteraceae bacterium]
MRFHPRLVMALAFALLLTACIKPMATPADPIGPPVRAVSEGADQVFLLTSQWKSTRSSFRGMNSQVRTDLLIDVWAFDSAGLKPLWRTRLESNRGGVNMGRALLGVQDGVVWIYGAKGLTGLSVKDGAVIADNARIEAANPDQKGMLPTEARYVRFDGGGLRIQCTDGREWRIDGRTLKLTEAGPAPNVLAPGVSVPSRDSGGNGTGGFFQRYVRLGDRFLGLMSDEDAKTHMAGDTRAFWWSPYGPRMRLWAGRYAGGERPAAYPRLKDLGPLPDAPDFLSSGMLAAEQGRTPIFLREPDSVIILSADKLGEGAELKLTRVSGPSGKVVWTADLHVARLSTVSLNGDTLVMVGARLEQGNGDREPVEVPQLISVNVRTGQVSWYGFRIMATEAADIPPSSTPTDAAAGS